MEEEPINQTNLIGCDTIVNSPSLPFFFDVFHSFNSFFEFIFHFFRSSCIFSFFPEFVFHFYLRLSSIFLRSSSIFFGRLFSILKKKLSLSSIFFGEFLQFFWDVFILFKKIIDWFPGLPGSALKVSVGGWWANPLLGQP